jgi:predicted ArsR family transcriptional regulator
MRNTSKRKTRWTNQLLSEISQLDNNKGIDILNSCGKACFEKSDLYQSVAEFRKNCPAEKGTDQIFHEFMESYYSSGNITKTGNTITLIFEECSCPMVETGVSNPFLCNCTTGYSKELFEILFDRKVRVDLEQSILQGDSICREIITIIE